MMAENPNWWSMMNGMHPHDEPNDHQNISSHEQKFVCASADSPLSNSNTTAADHHPTTTQDFPVIRSWSQLLLGGLAGGEEEEGGGGGGGERLFNNSVFQQQKKLENNWEEQVLFNLQNQSNYNNSPVFDVKQEQLVSQSTNSRSGGGQLYDNEDDCDQILLSNSWPNHHHHHHEAPLASNFSNNNNNNFFNCSGGRAAAEGKNNVHQHNQDYSSECNSTSNNGGVSKKARVHQSSAQPALKVRKEKLGDRITALHQLVSPFGKTDTASVLSEAIGYIRFLQSQIQALSFPYMRNASPVHNTAHHHHHQHSVQERNCLINPEEAADLQDSQTGRGARDLRSRGLCLVPISCTENVGNDNGADYWAPSTIGGGF